MGATKTRFCDECGHGYYDGRDRFICRQGWRPRFYLPRHSMDNAYGYKRRCDDYTLRGDVRRISFGGVDCLEFPPRLEIECRERGEGGE